MNNFEHSWVTHLQFSQQQAAAVADSLKALGVDWIRMGVHFDSHYSDANGNLTSGIVNYDWQIDLLASRGFNILLNLVQPSGPVPDSAWANHVRSFVHRYGDRVKHWEIGNEPEDVLHWRNNWSSFINLVNVGAPIIRRGGTSDPNVWDWDRTGYIVAGAMVHVGPYPHLLAQLVQEADADAFSTHVYQPASNAWNDVKRNLQIVVDNDLYGRKMWVTEFGDNGDVDSPLVQPLHALVVNDVMWRAARGELDRLGPVFPFTAVGHEGVELLHRTPDDPNASNAVFVPNQAFHAYARVSRGCTLTNPLCARVNGFWRWGDTYYTQKDAISDFQVAADRANPQDQVFTSPNEYFVAVGMGIPGGLDTYRCGIHTHGTMWQTGMYGHLPFHPIVTTPSRDGNFSCNNKNGQIEEWFGLSTTQPVPGMVKLHRAQYLGTSDFLATIDKDAVEPALANGWQTFGSQVWVWRGPGKPPSTRVDAVPRWW